MKTMQMKRFLTTLATGALIGMTIGAVPAKRGITTKITTPDGTTIEATLGGDEHARYYTEPATGRLFKLDAQGRAIATTHDEISHMRQRSMARRHAANNNGPSQAPQARIGQSDKNSDYCLESLGAQRIPVILVDYKDRKFSQGDGAIDTFVDFFQEGEKSGRQYFIDNSNGRFQPQFDVFGPYHLTKNMAYYGTNDEWGNDKALGEMVAEGCRLATDVDFSNYDNDGDGYCDVVILIYAGNGEAQSGKTTTIWPCQWDLMSSEYGKTVTLNGVKINNFAVFNELNGTSSTKIDGIGTFCHEFSHVLGLPDYYNTDNRYSYYGMGSWSLMDYGCYADEGYTPAGYTAYDKMTLGWIDDIPQPQPATTLSLTPMNQGSADTDIAYRLTGTNPDEYYVIENRARNKWDQFLPDEGMLIYHVNFERRRWDENTVNSKDPLCMALVAADNSRSDYTEEGDLYPHGDNDAFTDTSTPAATLYTGGKLGKPITNIRLDPQTGIVTCDFMPQATPTLPTPQFDAENTPSQEDMEVTRQGFTAKWPAIESDIPFTYTLQVAPHSEISYTLLAEESFAEATTWETEGFAEIEEGTLRLGSAKQLGGVISPAFSYDGDGDLTVTISAKAYATDTDVILNICLLDNTGAEITSQPLAISSSLGAHGVKFTGCTPRAYSVAVETSEKKKRANLAWVKIYAGDAMETIAGSQTAHSQAQDNPATETMLFEGLQTTSHTVTGLTFGGTYDWRVRAVPVDGTTAEPGNWSSPVTVTINGQSSINIATNDAAAPAPVYHDLAGRRVDNPGPGIYIVTRGNEITKQVVH